jgi:hypothetical protein
VTSATSRRTGICLLACCLLVATPGLASAQAASPDSVAAIAEVRAACGSAVTIHHLGLLRGEVRDADSQPAAAVAVTVGWHRTIDAPPGRTGLGAVTDEAALGTFSDSTGHWHICGAPLGVALVIRAVDDGGSDARTVTLDAAGPVAPVELALRAADGAGNPFRAPRTTALVVFSVEDRGGNALGGVTLHVLLANAAVREAVTDSAGHAIFPSVVPGRARVQSLAIGYRPGDVWVPLDGGRNTVPLILDAARTPTLATVRVIGDRQVLARHQDFEARRSAHQASASITAEDIDKRNPIDTWQMLTNIPAMRVIQYGSGLQGVFAVSNREQPVVQRKGGPAGVMTVPCWYRLMLDGVLLPDPMPDLSSLLPPPSEVHGIEVFAGLATIPTQYSGTVTDGQGGTGALTCGLIAVWTK